MDDALPPEVTAPLAPFKGEKPPAPAWFDAAIAQEPERFSVEVKGAQIECLAWGERGNPGIVLVHGASAHADWWSFIAPFLAADGYRVAALSLSGMGGSDWRPSYDFFTFCDEVDACARAAGLFEAAPLPFYVGHSFGGAVVYVAARAFPERMRATIMIDSGFGGPPRESANEASKNDVGPPRRPMGKIYATEEEALARFRFLPPQVPGCLFITDFIARRSLKRAPMPDGSGEGWTWRFDPDLFPRLDRSQIKDLEGKSTGRALHLYGDRSKLINRVGGLERLKQSPIPSVAIPEAEHHIMVDQPLALIAAIRTALAGWTVSAP